jgi:hypothetical protein
LLSCYEQQHILRQYILHLLCVPSIVTRFSYSMTGGRALQADPRSAARQRAEVLRECSI